MADIKDDTTLDFGPEETIGNKTDVSSQFDKFVDESTGSEVKADDTSIKAAEEGSKETKEGSQPDEAGKDSGSSSADKGAQQPNNKQEKAPVAGAGDLTTPDGTVIKAGAERRMYEQLSVARQEVAALNNTSNQLRDNLRTTRTELNAMREAVQQTTGTDPQTVASAVTLYKQIKADPSGTLRLLLTEAKAAGINVDVATAPADPTDSIVRQIEARLAPLLEPLQQQRTQQAEADGITQEVTSFYNTYPDARVHDHTMALILEANPAMSLQQAYFQLKSAAAARGLDWTKPLAQQAPPASSEQQQQTPMVQGRTPASPLVPANRVPVADDSMSMADIIRAAMRDNGLKA